ncbi:MAG TPA: hypothetical protein VHH36_04725, partial [Candidatus Thermoplasmatota archaeon]|nr:hypothetical protein [Candidatus Thermoplasmatota archaeon]
LTAIAFLAAGAGVVWGTLVATAPGARERLLAPPGRHRLRGAVDASLWLSMWLATLTGLVLLYATGWLRGLGGYWLMVGWHVVASAVLAGLVAWHVGFNARPLRAHAR